MFGTIKNILFKTLEKRIKYFHSNNRNYQYFVVIRKTNVWQIVEKIDSEFIIVNNKQYKYNSIESLIVAYANGEILDYSGEYYALPSIVSFIKENDSNDDLKISNSLVELNSKEIIFKHRFNANHPDKSFYITEITNNSSMDIKVISFAGYEKVDNEFIISTVTGKIYTSEQFVHWYGCDHDFIEVNQKVCDFNNYGCPAYWIFKVEFKDKSIKYLGTYVSEELLGF